MWGMGSNDDYAGGFVILVLAAGHKSELAGIFPFECRSQSREQTG